ncbi:FHA domain-containing protein [Phormidesmis priestleyi]
MNLEPTPPESQPDTPEEIALALFQSIPDVEAFDQAFWNELDEISEENHFTRAQTLLIDFEDQANIEFDKAAIDPKPKYVQGVLQAGQVYLITNLLHNRSQTLIQSQKVWTIGRHRAAALPLQDRKMSRRHAVILYADFNFYLLDLNSMNGSYVNGDRVKQRQLLQDGDRVCLGHTEFLFYVSQRSRTLDLIHPEVFSRFSHLESRSTPFVDYIDESRED